MKRIFIIAMVMVGVAIALLINASGDMSTYATFKDAQRQGKRVKIAGQLVKEREMYYKPEEDPNYFSFYIKDTEGIEQKVVLLQAKPQDFELSEQIVVTGEIKGEDFVATDLLMKCPSKYKDEELKLEGKKQ